MIFVLRNFYSPNMKVAFNTYSLRKEWSKLTSNFTNFEPIVKFIKMMDGIDEVELLDRAHHKTTQLSGGEIQRISLAVALANKPELVVLDEPTGELDSQTSEKIVAFFEKINKDLGVTMILATHDRRLIARGYRTMLLVDGRITSVRRGFVDEDNIPVFSDAFGALQIPASLREIFQSREDIVLSRESEEVFKLTVPKKPTS